MAKKPKARTTVHDTTTGRFVKKETAKTNKAGTVTIRSKKK